MHKFIYLIIISVMIFIPGVALAEELPGLGKLAEDLMGPLSVVGDLITTASLILGGIFIFASIIKYLQYRVNPLYVPISTVIFLLILGIVLLLLPLMYLLLYEIPPYK